MTEFSPPDGIKVVDKTIRVITMLAQQRQGCTLAELAALTHFPRSTVQRIVEALRKHSWVTNDDGIRLGPGLLALLPPDENPALDVIHAHAEHLWQESGETVTTGRLIGAEVIFMKKWISPHELRFVPSRKSGFPANCMSNGKALLALKSDDELRRELAGELPVLTPASIKDRATLLRELANVRENGFAEDNEEYVQGISSFSVAVPVTAGFSCAVTLSSPTPRFNSRKEALREMLLTMRDAIVSDARIIAKTAV